MIEEIDFFGISISSFTEEELWARVDHDIKNKAAQVYYGSGFYNITVLKQFPVLHQYSRKVDVMLMDGHPFKKFCDFLGYRIKYEISIPRFTIGLLNHVSSEKKVFALGGTEEVNKLALDSIISDYGKIHVSGRNGYFTESEEASIVEEINRFSPDVLLIGISTPIKERFFYKWKETLNVGIIVPCGGMLDVLAKKTKLTPAWIKRLGLATIYRVVQEPRRLLKSRMIMLFQVAFKIVPVLIYQRFVKRNRSYFLPGLFGVKR